MSLWAWVTLATNDDYALGALTLARSIRTTETIYDLVVLVTRDLSEGRMAALRADFNVVEVVDPIESTPDYYSRPELGVTLTKIHCWRLVQYEKCVFLDADTLMVQNCDNLFYWDELSAAPDVGWPDCFNSGVFVFTPSIQTFNNLMALMLEKGSFDGADQGLLNAYYSDWFMRPANRLPFVYNAAFSTAYFYQSAFKKFELDLKILHFLGATKPWHTEFNQTSRRVEDVPEAYQHIVKYLDYWWRLQMQKPTTIEQPRETTTPSEISIEAPRNNDNDNEEKQLQGEGEEHNKHEVRHVEPEPDYQAWQTGQMDYLGVDSFLNIKTKLEQTIKEKEKK